MQSCDCVYPYASLHAHQYWISPSGNHAFTHTFGHVARTLNTTLQNHLFAGRQCRPHLISYTLNWENRPKKKLLTKFRTTSVPLSLNSIDTTKQTLNSKWSTVRGRFVTRCHVLRIPTTLIISAWPTVPRSRAHYQPLGSLTKAQGCTSDPRPPALAPVRPQQSHDPSPTVLPSHGHNSARAGCSQCFGPASSHPHPQQKSWGCNRSSQLPTSWLKWCDKTCPAVPLYKCLEIRIYMFLVQLLGKENNSKLANFSSILVLLLFRFSHGKWASHCQPLVFIPKLYYWRINEQLYREKKKSLQSAWKSQKLLKVAEM